MAGADCIFCKIVRRELESEVVYEDEEVMAFKDIHPIAPVHVLVVPKRHIASLADATEEDQEILGKTLLGLSRVARKLGLDASGYRTIVNTGRGAGQSVFHLHFHLLSGKRFSWP